jgi:cytochrome c nitrite reductase small subunit
MFLRWGGLRLLAALAVGLFLGVAAFTFHYGEGTSYFSTDPRACVNCHIMQPQYDSWTHSSHHAVAGCVDCHLPHSFIPKYLAKGENGLRHSWAFTFQNFHEPIQITARNARILQNNCVHCHEPLAHEMLVVEPDEAISCVHCHAQVGHGAAR